MSHMATDADWDELLDEDAEPEGGELADWDELLAEDGEPELGELSDWDELLPAVDLPEVDTVDDGWDDMMAADALPTLGESLVAPLVGHASFVPLGRPLPLAAKAASRAGRPSRASALLAPPQELQTVSKGVAWARECRKRKHEAAHAERKLAPPKQLGTRPCAISKGRLTEYMNEPIVPYVPLPFSAELAAIKDAAFAENNVCGKVVRYCNHFLISEKAPLTESKTALAAKLDISRPQLASLGHRLASAMVICDQLERRAWELAVCRSATLEPLHYVEGEMYDETSMALRVRDSTIGPLLEIIQNEHSRRDRPPSVILKMRSQGQQSSKACSEIGVAKILQVQSEVGMLLRTLVDKPDGSKRWEYIILLRDQLVSLGILDRTTGETQFEKLRRGHSMSLGAKAT